MAADSYHQSNFRRFFNKRMKEKGEKIPHVKIPAAAAEEKSHSPLLQRLKKEAKIF